MSKSYWGKISSDLGVAIFHPYTVVIGASKEIIADAFFPNFGGKNGMLVFHDARAVEGCESELVELGYGYSCFAKVSEGDYERDGVIEMLADWGWNQESALRPQWLSEMDDH